jgi:hypothetical protein
MNILELDSYNLADAVKFNDQLNPKLWGADEHLLPEVREKLLAIADEFREFLGVNDLQLKDITISGSNAAYTYTPHSDIDLHLVVDLPEADRNEVYRELFDAKKYVFNDMHTIKIGGYDVELYVQDANKAHHSQGIYSVVNNDWVDVPKRRRTEIDDVSTRSKYEDLAQRIDAAIASGSYKQMSSLTEKIRDMRQSGLDEHGEFGPENLAFKMLRSQGKIKELYDARNAAKDQELSLKERDRHKPVFRYGFGRPNMEDLDTDGVMMTRPTNCSSESVEVEEDLDVDGVMMTRPTNCSSESAGDTESDESILTDFIDFCSKELKLEHLPTIKLRKDPQWPVVHKTFGRYINDKQLLEVAWGHRHIMDVLRTVAHELTHRHQHERDGDRMDNTAGETGSPWENEANARAGILMRDYARLHPDFFALGQAHDLVEKKDTVDESASGYIPTKKQAKDPRWSMALTVDIKPGQLGKEANKLKLKTDRQGKPQQLNPNGLIEALALQLDQFKKKGVLAEAEELDEVRMNPTALKKFAASPAARGILVGFEAELIFPNVRVEDEDPEYEPDYDADERCTSLDQVVEFFQYDEWGYGLSDREADRLRESLDEAYYEWYDGQMRRDFGEEAEDYIRKIMVEDGDWDEDNEIQKQLYLLDLPDDKINDIINAGERAPKFTSSKEQQEYAEANPDYKTYLDAQEEAQDLLDTLIQDEMGKQGANWDAALDDFRDHYQLDDDSGFWSDSGWRWMSDIANQFNLSWPYVTSTNSGEGEMDIDTVADSLSEAVGMPVKASYNYHGAPRKPGQFIVEPDGSLSPDSSEDGGLEIISPPMPIEQAMEKLNAVIAWAQKSGCYTNSTTGLHMGVSLPGQKSFAEAEGDEVEPAPATEKPIDFMKLALFLGDQHVLKQFERQANHYCASTLKKLKEKKWSPQQIATAMEKMRGNLINLAYKDLADRSPGRDSINMKDNYVEFRGAGGDYLSKESDQGMDFLENTLLRYVQALAIAGDPSAYRNEYAKKLYKLISPEGDTTLDLFSKFATGEITSEELKKDWAKRTLEKDKPKQGEEREWEAYNPDTGEVLGSVNDFSITNATNYFRDEMKLDRFQVREKEPELTTSRAKLAKNIVAQGPGPKVYYKWDISNPKSGEASTDYMTRDRVFQTTRQVEKENPKGGKYTNTIVGQGSAQLTSNQHPREIDTMTFDFRAKGSDEVVEQKTFTRQEQDASPVVSAIERANELAKKLGKSVTAYEVTDTTAKPAQAKDYNYEIVNLGDVNLGVVDKFYATDKQDADATFDKWLEMKGLPNDTSNYGYRPRKQEPAPSTNPNPTASIANQARAVNGVPMWELFDVDTGSVLHAIADHTGREAYDQGMAWLRSIGAENPETYGERFAIRPKLETSSAQDAAELQRNTEPGEWEFYRTETGNVIDRVNDASRMQANAVRQDIVRRYGHPDASVGMRRVDQQGVRDVAPDVAQNFTQPTTYQIFRQGQPSAMNTFQAATHPEAIERLEQFRRAHSSTPPHEFSLRNLPVNENFADGRNPQDKGDSQRHGIPKGATMAELEKASHSAGRRGQLARWQLNMRRGKKK